MVYVMLIEHCPSCDASRTCVCTCFAKLILRRQRRPRQLTTCELQQRWSATCKTCILLISNNYYGMRVIAFPTYVSVRSDLHAKLPWTLTPHPASTVTPTHVDPQPFTHDCHFAAFLSTMAHFPRIQQQSQYQTATNLVSVDCAA